MKGFFLVFSSEVLDSNQPKLAYETSDLTRSRTRNNVNL